MNKLQIFKRRLKGESVHQLALAFQSDAIAIETIIEETIREIKDACRLDIKQRLTLELERIDNWANGLEELLDSACEDILDPETGKLLRDGARLKITTIRALLEISKHRSNLLKLTTIQEDIQTEAQKLFNQIENIDIDDLQTIEDIIEHNKQLNKIQ